MLCFTIGSIHNVVVTRVFFLMAIQHSQAIPLFDVCPICWVILVSYITHLFSLEGVCKQELNIL